MSTPARPRVSRALQAVTTALLVLAAALFAPTAASAHDTLIDSSPAAGSAVDTLPAALTLTFSAELITGDGTTFVEITDPTGAPARAGEPVVEGAVVTIPLAEAAPAGEYAVEWRVVSSDGHPISGEFVFDVLTATEPGPTPEPTSEPSAEATQEATTAPTAAPSPEATDTASDTTPDDNAFLGALPWIIGGVLLLAILAAVVFVLAQRRRRGRPTASDQTSGR